MHRLHSVPTVREVPAQAARLLLEAGAGDPAAWQVIVPVFEVAAAVRAHLAAEVGSRGLLAVAAPRIATFESLVEGARLGRAVTSRARRLADLRQVLAGRGWFGGAPTWEACQAVLELADELSSRLPEPPDEAGFLRQVEAHYRGRAARLAEPEARLVYEVWRAWARPVPGAPLDPGMARRMLVSEAARGMRHPVLWLCARPGGRLSAEEEAFAALVEASHPLLIVAPDSLPRAFALAWPDEARESPAERAARLDHAAREQIRGVRILRAGTLEAEAQSACRQVRAWLAEGRRAIALVAQDRAAARRVRALLEREGVLVADEAGWKLSTTRAATCAMRWVEAVIGGFHHRDLLDWLRSPFALADWARDARDGAVATLDEALRRHNVQAGIEAMRHALPAGAPDAVAARAVLARIEAASRPWSRRTAPPGEWFDLLLSTLRELGALDALAEDAAGAPLVARVQALVEQMQGAQPMSLAVWRDFFAAELELVSFRDTAIDSPVVMTSLEQATLRAFDAVLLLGGGETHLGHADAPGLLFGERLRAQLGLATARERGLESRDLLAALIGGTSRFCATWMAGGEREPQRLSSWFARLDALSLAAGLGTRVEAVLQEPEAGAARDMARRPAPAAPRLLPAIVSASACASLVTCPYQFFARHMLGLNEADEVREEFEKRDYGTWVHALLNRLHREIPQLSALPRETVLGRFRAIADDVFAEPVAFNFLSLGWKARILALAVSYIDWQCAREAEGWRWHEGEVDCSVAIALPAGGEVRLIGRLDRVDRRGDELAILDYKTQRRERLARKVEEVGEDVQLALYGLLHPEGGSAQALYVALDGDAVSGVALSPEHTPAAERERLGAALAAIAEGAGLPANAPESACAWCEMRGLCRRAHWPAAEAGDA